MSAVFDPTPGTVVCLFDKLDRADSIFSLVDRLYREILGRFYTI